MKFKIALFFVFVSLSAVSQEWETQLISTIPIGHKQFVGVDKYGSIYSVDKNRLYKKTDKKEYSFSSLRLGRISSVDMLNPLKITVFYEDLNTVVLLDDKLNEIRRINFNEHTDFKNVSFASKAYKNTLWLLDTDAQEVEVFDYKTKKNVARSHPIREEVKQMQTNYNYAWVLSSSKLRRYNIYGSKLDEFPAEDIQKISYYNKNVLVLKEEELAFLNPEKQTFYNIKTPAVNIQDFYTADGNLYIYDGEILYHYSLNFSK